MSLRAISPRELMGAMLELVRGEFTGSFLLGGRRFRVHEGALVHIDPGHEDEELLDFLLASGRLSEETAAAIVQRAGEDDARLDALITEALGREEVNRSSRRALLLERTLRALRAAETGESIELSLEEETPSPNRPPRVFALLPLLLDALSRLAGEAEAETVGASAHLLFALHPNADPTLAEEWTGLEIPSSGAPIAKLLSQSPGAASQLGALLRAGWAIIGTKEELQRSIASARRERKRSLVEYKQMQLELSSPTESLADPIETIEEAIREAIASGAAPEELARLHQTLASTWEHELHSLEGAALSHRSAVAIHPHDLDSMLEAARLCRALGQHELSRSYAHGASLLAEEAHYRDRALSALAIANYRLGETAAAKDALASLAHLRRDDGDLYEHLARAAGKIGKLDEAVEYGVRAIRLLEARHPSRARTIAEWLHSLDPSRDDLIALYASLLAREGFGRASLALLALSAMATNDPDLRRARLSLVTERAEIEKRADLAFDLLARAFDDEPTLDVFYEPLDAIASVGCPPAVRAAMLEAIACAAPSNRAHHFLNAAYAFAQFDEGRAIALEYAARSLMAERESDTARALISELIPTTDEWRVLEARLGGDEAPLFIESHARGRIDGLLYRASLALLQGERDAAFALTLNALELDPRHPLALARAERIARWIGERSKMERAFDFGLRAAHDAREQARLLMHLALLASERGDELTATNRSLEAIRVEPSCAEAYFFLAGRLDHLPNEALGSTVERSRAAIGDSVVVMERAMEIAQRRGLTKLLLRMRESRARMSVLDEGAIRARLLLAAFSENIGTVQAAIRAVLDHPDLIEIALDELLAALARAFELDAKLGAELALSTVHRHGEGSILGLIAGGLDRIDDPILKIRILEAQLSYLPRRDRVDRLTTIASLHASVGSLGGEHRSLLRALALDPSNRKVIHRLASIYAKTYESARLEGILQLFEESASTVVERIDARMQLARVQLEMKDAPDEAIVSLRSVLSETTEGEDPLFFQLDYSGDLLLLIEEACLRAGSIDFAHEAYGALCKCVMGKDSKRALALRRAELFHRLGDEREALRLYQESFALDPRPGHALSQIEALAARLNDPASLAEAHLVLAEASDDADVKTDLTMRAVATLESLGHTARATHLLHALFEATNRLAILPKLFSLLGTLDPSIQKTLLEDIVMKLADRVEGSWDFGDQLRCLKFIVDAELMRGDAEAASAAANRAAELAKAEDEPPVEELAFIHHELGEALIARGEPSRGKEHLFRALEIHPSFEASRESLKRLGVPEAGIGAADDECGESAKFEREIVSDVVRRAHAHAERLGQEAAPPAAPSDAADNEEIDALVHSLRLDPAQPAIWLALSELEDAGGGPRHIARAVYAAFEPGQPPPNERPFEWSCPIELPDPSEREILLDQLLRTIERSVRDLLPQSPEALGASSNDLVPYTEASALSRSFRRLAASVELEGVRLYRREGIGTDGKVIASEPPAFLVDEALEHEPNLLDYRIARLLALSGFGSKLVGSRRSNAELESLFSALVAACQPTASAAEAASGGGGKVVESSYEGGLASLLRKKMSSHAREAILSIHEEIKPRATEAIHYVESRASLFALLHTGMLYAAIAEAFRTDPPLKRASRNGLESLYGAVKESRLLRHILEISLNPAFIACYNESQRGTGS